jgi:hypothetical protein
MTTPLRCPVCRADNSERTCRRCRADLGLLWDVRAARTEALARARKAWLEGDAATAHEAAAEAARLEAGADTWRWAAVTALAQGDFVAALAAWRAATAPGGER